MNRFDRALRELKRERPAHGIDRAGANFGASNRRKTFPRAVAATGGLATAFGLVLLTRAPAQASLSTEMLQAVEGIDRTHTRWFDVARDKSETLSMEQWTEGSRIRNDFQEKDGTGAQIQHAYDGKRKWLRLRAGGYVTVRNSPAIDMRNGWPLFADLVGTLKRKDPDAQVERTMVDGRPMLRIAQTMVGVHDGSGYRNFRIYWLAEEGEDKRPTEVRIYRKTPEGLILTSRGRIDYPEDIEDTTFRLDPAPGETLFDKDEERQAMKRRWTKGLGRQTVAGREIVLRDVFVDRHQCVGLLWTGGERLRQFSKATVTDARGRKWVGIPMLYYTNSKVNHVPDSRLTKIAGKPNRALFIYGVAKDLQPPLRITIPVNDAKGNLLGEARFTANPHPTDRLADFPSTLRN